MSKVTMIGCDLHDASMMVKIAVGTEEAIKKAFATSDRAGMIAWVKDFAQQHEAPRIVFAYEASGQGFGLYDTLTDAGIECYVLAPTHLPHTPHQRKNKTDEKDAQMILDEVRGHVLAGRKLPKVWVPDPQTRDDREVVRMRLEVGEQRTRIKNQIRTLAKRAKLVFPTWFTSSGNWSKRSVQWLRQTAIGEVGEVSPGLRLALGSLVDLHEELDRQLKVLDQGVLRLAKSDRYVRTFRKLKLMPGVGTLTAMVFLAELGDLNRFANRRQLAAYLGLAPTAFESGSCQDRKGHITRQGPARVRHVLCQAAWAALRCSETWRAKYETIKRGSKKRSKIAIVAIMRRLAITMWHTARSRELDELLVEVDQQKASVASEARPASPRKRGAASSRITGSSSLMPVSEAQKHVARERRDPIVDTNRSRRHAAPSRSPSPKDRAGSLRRRSRNNGKHAGRDSRRSSGSLGSSTRGRGRVPAIDRPAARSVRSRSDQEPAQEAPGGELLESPRQASLQRSPIPSTEKRNP